MARTWLAGFASLFAALLAHEVISFGVCWGFLTGEREMVSYFYPSGIGEIIGLNLLFACVTALLFVPVAFVLRARRYRFAALGMMWLALFIWGNVQTAMEYRAHFGATWLPHEPFFELMWSPVLTPSLTLLGLLTFRGALPRS